MRTRSAAQRLSALPHSDATPAQAPLPPELVARVLALAEGGATAVARQHLRTTFALVCKAWAGLVDHLTVVVIASLADVSRLQGVLRSAAGRRAVAARARAVVVDLTRFREAVANRRLCSILAKLTNVETVVIEEVGRAHACMDSIDEGSPLADALAKFANLRHFTLLPVAAAPARQLGRIQLSVLHGLATCWPALETVALEQCRVFGPARVGPGSGVFETCGRLTQLLVTAASASQTLAVLCANLPPSLRSLHLIVSDLHDPDGHAPALVDRLLPIAPALTDLLLLGADAREPRPFSRPPLAALVPTLTAVERLAVQPGAVGDVAALAGLPRLAELRLVRSRGALGGGFSGARVEELVREARGLRSVWVGPSLHARWGQGEREGVERAAEERSVRMAWA